MLRSHTPKTRNPAFGGVSSFRVRLPATGADLLRGGRAPSRFLYTPNSLSRSPPLNKSSRVEADEGDSQSTVPAGRDITNEFRLAPADDVQTLTIERLGEN